MKKLMVMAAAAALTGVAVAEGNFILQPSIYDLTISVKSTTGKAAKGSEKAYTVNLGKDSNGNFWYTDNCIWDGAKGKHVDITTNPNGKAQSKFAVKGASGTIYKQVLTVTYKSKTTNKMKDKPVLDISGLTDKEKADVAAAFGFDGSKTRYNKKSDNQWCTTFQYKDVVLDRCYRVATSYTYKYQVASIDCCGQDPWQFEVFASDADLDVDEPLFPIETIMLYRFNAAQLEKANKVEYIGKVGNFAKANEKWAWAFAGQGDWSDSLTWKYKDANNKKQKESYSGVKSISGNIVGSLPPATCEGCCGVDDQAIAFTCDALDSDDIAWFVEEDEEMMTTAMFGTFTLKWKKCLFDEY